MELLCRAPEGGVDCSLVCVALARRCTVDEQPRLAGARCTLNWAYQCLNNLEL